MLFTRPAYTADAAIWKEVFLHNEYRLDKFSAEERIVDVGAHIGCFALNCLTRGATQIHCYEADHRNFEQLAINMEPFHDKVHVNHAAMWRSDTFEKTVLLNGFNEADPNTGGGSVVSGGGTEAVRTRKLDDVITELEYIHWLKVDCEGAEYPILFSSKKLDKVGRILVETHNHIPFSQQSIVRGHNNTPEHLTEYLLSPVGGAFREVTTARNMTCQNIKNIWAIR